MYCTYQICAVVKFIIKINFSLFFLDDGEGSSGSKSAPSSKHSGKVQSHHRVNIYKEEKATQIALQLQNFMSFDRNSYAFILYTVCIVYTTVNKSLPHL